MRSPVDEAGWPGGQGFDGHFLLTLVFACGSDGSRALPFAAPFRPISGICETFGAFGSDGRPLRSGCSSSRSPA